jgi:hypothetical protein
VEVFFREPSGLRCARGIDLNALMIGSTSQSGGAAMILPWFRPSPKISGTLLALCQAPDRGTVAIGWLREVQRHATANSASTSTTHRAVGARFIDEFSKGHRGGRQSYEIPKR